MDTEGLSERHLRRAKKLLQSASRIEQYILEHLDTWYAFRESLLANDEMRILNMHEDLDGTSTDWRKILLVFNEPQIGNFPVLCIYPPKPGTNLKHVVTIEMMEKNKVMEPEGLFWFGLFRSKISQCDIKLHCKEKMTYTDEEGYKFHIDAQAKAKLSFDKLVAFLEQLNNPLEEITNPEE